VGFKLFGIITNSNFKPEAILLKDSWYNVLEAFTGTVVLKAL
jgi:hypothetical protein